MHIMKFDRRLLQAIFSDMPSVACTDNTVEVEERNGTSAHDSNGESTLVTPSSCTPQPFPMGIALRRHIEEMTPQLSLLKDVAGRWASACVMVLSFLGLTLLSAASIRQVSRENLSVMLLYC